MQRKKLKRKLHNGILYAITFVAAVAWVFSACTLDADSWLPVRVWLISSAWLGLFIYANGEDADD